jgi:hypothetical protein
LTPTPRTWSRRRSRVLVGTATLLTVVFAACSSDDEPSAGPSSTTTAASAPTSTATTAPDPQAAAVSAYRAFWASYLAAADPMNPEDPRLADHATGEELKNVRSAFLAFRSAGHVIRGTFELAPQVVSFDGSSAQIRDCYDDATGVFAAATGARQDVDDPRRHQVTAKVVNIDGAWKVTTITNEGLGCQAG